MNDDKPKKARKPRKLEPFTDRWWQRAGKVALMYVGTMIPCADCGGPVVKGYICTRCDSTNPDREA